MFVRTVFAASVAFAATLLGGAEAKNLSSTHKAIEEGKKNERQLRTVTVDALRDVHHRIEGLSSNLQIHHHVEGYGAITIKDPSWKFFDHLILRTTKNSVSDSFIDSKKMSHPLAALVMQKHPLKSADKFILNGYEGGKLALTYDEIATVLESATGEGLTKVAEKITELSRILSANPFEAKIEQRIA